MKVVAYIHERGEGFGRLAGYFQRVTERYRSVEPSDARADLVISLGGPMAVYERHDFLDAELEVLRERVKHDRPTLGICLGAQMLAAAAGARVYPGENGFELGVAPLQSTDELLGGLGDVAHWHGDTFDPVPGATLLASTDRYAQQAFRKGRSIGLQFHPELDAETFLRWARACPDDLRRAGRTLDELERVDAARLRAAEPQLERFCARLAAQFTTNE